MRNHRTRLERLEQVAQDQIYDISLLTKYLTPEELEQVQRAEQIIEAAQRGDGTDYRPEDPPDTSPDGWLRYVSEPDLHQLKHVGAILERANLQYKADKL